MSTTESTTVPLGDTAETMRQCKTCTRMLPLSEFRPTRGSKGHLKTCKSCYNAELRAAYAAHAIERVAAPDWRSERLALIERQKAEGTLIVRQMTAEERKFWGPAPPQPRKRSRRSKTGLY